MIVELTPIQVELLTEQIVAVYSAAFGGAPYFKTQRESHEFATWLPHHVVRPAFRFMAAMDEESGRIVGFAYGYASISGQWWHDQVSRALPAERAREWLANTYQLSEIAVAPSHQGRRLGAGLHDALLGSDGAGPGPLKQQRAVLSTLATETVALAMYRRRGWETLLDTFNFPGVTRVYRILGRPLPYQPPPTRSD